MFISRLLLEISSQLFDFNRRERQNFISSAVLILHLRHDIIMLYTIFFNKQHLYKQRRTEIGKNQTKVKQHPEPELLLFDNYSFSSSTLSSKNNRGYSKNVKITNTSI